MAFKGCVLEYLTSIFLHSGEDGIVEGLLYIVSVMGIPRHLEKFVIQLHPSESHACLHCVEGCLCLSVMSSVPALHRCTGTANIDFLLFDVANHLTHNVCIVCTTSGLGKFQESYITRHHLIGFLPIILGPPIGLGDGEALCYRYIGFGNEARPPRLFPIVHNELGEVEIFAFTSFVEEIYYWFQDGGSGHTLVQTAVIDVSLVLSYLGHGVVE